MADNETTFLANADQLLAEHKKMDEAEKKYEEQLKKTAKQARESAREQKRLESEAARIREKNLTDLERHEKALKRLEHLKKREVLTEKEYLKAVAREKDEYRKNTQEFKDSQREKARLREQEEQQIKENAREQKKFNEEGKRLSEQARTPLQRYNTEVEKLNRQLKAGNLTAAEHARLVKRARTEYRNATQSGNIWSRSIKGMGTSLAGYATGLISATALLRTFISELEKSERLRQKSRDQTITDEEGLQRARANFVGDETVSKKNLDSEIRRYAKNAGVSVAEFATASADTFSARGDRTNRFALDATFAAFAASPNKDVTVARELAQSAGDFAKLGGSQSAEAIVGFLAQGQQSARITDVAKLGQAAFPATSAAVQNGASIEQGMEQFIALNNLIGDKEGRVSSTASVSLTEQLQKFEGTAGIEGGPAAQVKALQENRELAKAFMEFASFEKKSLAGVRSLVFGDERGAGALADAQKKIGSLSELQDPENIAAFNAYIKWVQGKGTISGDLKQVGRRVDRNIEGALSGNTDRTFISDVNTLLKKTIANINLPGLDYLTEKQINLRAQRVGSPEEAIQFAKVQLSERLDPSNPNNARVISEVGGPLRPAVPGSNYVQDASDVSLIRENLLALKRIEEVLERSRSDQAQQAAEQVRAVKKQGANPPQLGNDRNVRGQ